MRFGIPGVISKKGCVVIGIASLLLLVTIRLVYFPSGPRPLCHRAIDCAFQEWMSKSGQTNTRTPIYPNLNGKSSASLILIHEFMGDQIYRYGYVPGLRYDDPKELVLMYMRQKTRRTWHADSEHGPLRWMVLSPDFSDGHCPEGGELLDAPEFKRRLENTIAFLKKGQRPHWEVVAKEQAEFFRAIQ